MLRHTSFDFLRFRQRRTLFRSISQLIGEEETQHNELVSCELSCADLEIAAEVVNQKRLDPAGIASTQSQIASERRVVTR